MVLLKNKKLHKLELKGGNPYQEQDLVTSEDLSKPATGGKGLLGKIFGGKDKQTEDMAKAGKTIFRNITLEAKSFEKLPEQVQFELSSLPCGGPTQPSQLTHGTLVCKPLLSMAVTFRNHCYLLLTKHEQEMTQPRLDLVMVQFPKIYNSPDF